MAISSGPREIMSIDRPKKIQRSILKIFKRINESPLNFVMIFSIVVTGIGELISVRYSWEWYLMLFMILGPAIAEKIIFLRKTKK